MDTNLEKMTIGDLSKLSGVAIETIRYYEQVGILNPVSRSASGYRIFNSDSLKTLHFLKHAQKLGFSLSDIKELLKLKADKKSNCGIVKRKAKQHLKMVNDRIEKLLFIKNILGNLVEQCNDGKTDSRCPILDCFEK